jgi:hypothetical protein
MCSVFAPGFQFVACKAVAIVMMTVVPKGINCLQQFLATCGFAIHGAQASAIFSLYLVLPARAQVLHIQGF